MRIAATVFLLVAVALTATAQDKPSMVSAANTKFMSMDGVPACMKISAQRGDPAKEAAVILVKMSSGCKVPWHWHTANEALLIVSGKGKLEMKGSAAQNVAAADYAFLPGKHQHEFTCVAACTFFDVTEGAFDLHYVDKEGKEIPPAEALKASARPAAAKTAPKGEKK